MARRRLCRAAIAGRSAQPGGECPSCGWLFLDTTRNGSRRWCSMAMCGSQVKSRRYYAAKTAHRGS
ncbi:CGNR zinc finger domain-containing protein [Nonomuraea thailandensis]